MTNRKKKFQNLFFIIGIVILSFMVYKLGFKTIINNLKHTGWWFLAIFGIWLIVYFLNALCLKIILRDGSEESKRISVWRLMKLTISAYSINYITPLALGGEPYKIMEMKSDIGTHKATTSDLLYVMMHYVSHFFFWMLSVPLFIYIVPKISDFAQIILWGMVIGCFLLITWAYTVYTKGIIRNVLALGCRIPYFGKKIRVYRDNNKERFDEMDFLIADLYTNRKKDFFLSLGVELLSRIVWCLEIYFMVIPMGFDLNFIQCVLIYSFATLIANIFFFSPMQMGAREGGFALAVSLLSVPAGVGVFVGLLTRIRELFWILVGIGLMRIKRSK